MQGVDAEVTRIRTYLFRTAATILLCAAVFQAGCSQEPDRPEAPAAPEIETIGRAEILKAVNDSRGKVVLLNFWATWCDPCRAEIRELKEVRRAYGEDELLILGISVDREPRVVEAFVDRIGFNYPVYLATDSAAAFFRVQAVPRLMLYGPDGELKVNVEGLVGGNRLREIVDALLAG